MFDCLHYHYIFFYSRCNTDALYRLFEKETKHHRENPTHTQANLETINIEQQKATNTNDTQNSEQNPSSNKIVPMGQTRLPHEDKQDSPVGANTNNNINNIKKKNINKNKSPNPNSTIVDVNPAKTTEDADKELKNNCGFAVPKYEDILSYSKTFGERLAIDPDWFFEYNNKRSWTDKNGNPIKAWKVLFNNWNSLNITRLRKEEEQKAHAKAKTQEHIKQLEAERIHNEKARAKELEGKTQMSCQKCGRKLPDKNIELSVYDSTLTCHICNHSWSFIKDKQQSNEQMAVV